MTADKVRPPQKIHNVINGEWMWDDTFERRIQMKRRAGCTIGEWACLDRDNRALTVVGVSSRWKPLEMLDVYEIYADQG